MIRAAICKLLPVPRKREGCVKGKTGRQHISSPQTNFACKPDDNGGASSVETRNVCWCCCQTPWWGACVGHFCRRQVSARDGLRDVCPTAHRPCSILQFVPAFKEAREITSLPRISLRTQIFQFSMFVCPSHRRLSRREFREMWWNNSKGYWRSNPTNFHARWEKISLHLCRRAYSAPKARSFHALKPCLESRCHTLAPKTSLAHVTGTDHREAWRLAACEVLSTTIGQQ